jgi:hypothetical protein
MLITFGMKGRSYLCSQITGSVEDAVQEYLKFPYECFLSILPFEGLSSSVNSEKNCPSITCTYLSQLIVSLKNTGPTILLALEAHQTPTFTGLSGTSRVRSGFCELQ